ncbi:hypothetical protein J1614_001480 [Plenodomus biglobosus]|nr:hypothetical protein J1614_001480 [Plenodomus biglobosus]
MAGKGCSVTGGNQQLRDGGRENDQQPKLIGPEMRSISTSNAWSATAKDNRPLPLVALLRCCPARQNRPLPRPLACQAFPCTCEAIPTTHQLIWTRATVANSSFSIDVRPCPPWTSVVPPLLHAAVL